MIGFLGAFANLRKATVSFVMYIRLSVRPSYVRMEKFGSRWKEFHETLYLSIFRKFVEKI